MRLFVIRSARVDKKLLVLCVVVYQPVCECVAVLRGAKRSLVVEVSFRFNTASTSHSQQIIRIYFDTGRKAFVDNGDQVFLEVWM